LNDLLFVLLIETAALDEIAEAAAMADAGGGCCWRFLAPLLLQSVRKEEELSIGMKGLRQLLPSPLWPLRDSSYNLKTLIYLAGLWIRIRIGSLFSDFVDPDPYWEYRSGSRGKKMKKYQVKNALFSYLKKNLPLKRY
jgi:hypothetical protein